MSRSPTIRRYQIRRRSRPTLPVPSGRLTSYRPSRRASSKNLQGIPIVYVTAEMSGRSGGPAVVAFLKQAGCTAEDLQLKCHVVLGNGHFMMIENNRRQVFDVIQGWVEKNVPA
jgi:hypothetical protein